MALSLPLITHLKTPVNMLIFMGAVLLFWDMNYWIMKNTMGTGLSGLQCVPDGAFTTENIYFSILISFLMGLFVVGMKELFQKKSNLLKKSATLSIFSVSGLLGTFTVFCPVCTIGVVSIFGISFGLNVFLDYNTEIKVLSAFLLIFGLYWLNGQLKDDCKICRIIKK